MFTFHKVAAYGKATRGKDSYCVRITNIGDCPMHFVDYNLLGDGFKKITAMILIQRGGFVFVEDGVLPHADVIELDMQNTDVTPTNDAIVKETIRRIVYNAGTTIHKNTLRLIAVAENNDSVTYIYTAAVNKIMNNNSKVIKINQLTSREFLNKCSPKDVL